MASSRLAVTRLTLTNFRNFEDLRLDTDAGFIVLTGPNGSGKTNLLEAVSLLAPGRGLRGVAMEELTRIGGPGNWAVAANVEGLSGEAVLGTAWSRSLTSAEDSTSQARQVAIDGTPQRSSTALGDHLRLLWLTPALDRLFAGPVADRRRFFDRLVASFDAEHSSRLAVFEKLMRERNLLLAEQRLDRAWISSIETHMVEAGVAIAAARNAALDALQIHVNSLRSGGPFPWSALAIEGEIEAGLRGKPAVQVEDEYRIILADSRDLDRAAGRTLRGPHRSDFLVTHGPKSMPAAQCSTGEQKALLIGLILAQAQSAKEAIGSAPLLLLDEIAAHLDRWRREALFEAIGQLQGQAWMTGTDETLFESVQRDVKHFHVEAGTVSAVMRN